RGQKLERFGTFGVPPLGGRMHLFLTTAQTFHRGPPKGGTPNMIDPFDRNLRVFRVRVLDIPGLVYTAGSFWSRFPIFATLRLPIAFWFFRRDSRKELGRLKKLTICPKCETAGEGNAEAACGCGGRFALQSTVRWIDGPDAQSQDLPG